MSQLKQKQKETLSSLFTKTTKWSFHSEIHPLTNYRIQTTTNLQYADIKFDEIIKKLDDIKHQLRFGIM